MRAFEILCEDRRGLDIEKKDLINYIKEKCPIAYDRAKKGYFIYRGMEKDIYHPYIYAYKPHRGQRQSPYAHGNFYNLLLSKLDNWKDYPPRNRSLICASNVGKTSNYGFPHIVFPTNNPVIGICSDEDIWDSFPNFETINISDAEEFNIELQNFLTRLGKYSPKLQKSYPALRRAFADIKKMSQTKPPHELYTNTHNSVSDELMSDFDNFVFNKFNGDVEEAVKFLLDPEKNGFKKVRLSNYNVKGDREVWFYGSAILVEIEPYLDILKMEFGDIWGFW